MPDVIGFDGGEISDRKNMQKNVYNLIKFTIYIKRLFVLGYIFHKSSGVMSHSSEQNKIELDHVQKIVTWKL